MADCVSDSVPHMEEDHDVISEDDDGLTDDYDGSGEDWDGRQIRLRSGGSRS